MLYSGESWIDLTVTTWLLAEVGYELALKLTCADVQTFAVSITIGTFVSTAKRTAVALFGEIGNTLFGTRFFQDHLLRRGAYSTRLGSAKSDDPWRC